VQNPVYEQIRGRKVKARLRMLQHAERVSGNVSQTCRFFGVSRSLYYISKQRYEKQGSDGLGDLKRRPHRIRYRIPPEIVAFSHSVSRQQQTVTELSVGSKMMTIVIRSTHNAGITPPRTREGGSVAIPRLNGRSNGDPTQQGPSPKRRSPCLSPQSAGRDPRDGAVRCGHRSYGR
jgi:transposase-like protein